MKNKILTVVLGLLVVLVYTGSVQPAWWSSDDNDAAVGAVEITWQDLIPSDFVQPENPFDSMSQEDVDKLLDGSDESNARLEELRIAFEYAPTESSLDGKLVKLPAYITPLEFDGQMEMKEFLLVPYMGACMHSPPPPANQVVLAQSDELISLNNAYDPVWAVGVIRVDTVQSDLAEAGYRMEVKSVLPYGR